MLFSSDIATYIFIPNGNMLVAVQKPSTGDHHKNLNPKSYFTASLDLCFMLQML